MIGWADLQQALRANANVLCFEASLLTPTLQLPTVEVCNAQETPNSRQTKELHMEPILG